MNYIIPFFILIITGILSLAHTVVYFFIMSVFDINSTRVFFTLKTVFTILALSFVVSSVIAYFYNNLFIRIFYTFSAVWLGLMFYLFLSAVIYSLLTSLAHHTALNIPLKEIGIFLISFSIILWGYGVVHAEKIIVKKVSLELPQLPFEWKGRKAVWVSDVHLGQVHGVGFSQKIVSTIQELNPDIVFIGGDLFDGVKVDEKALVSPFSKLHPVLGTYFITGNHEEFSGPSFFINAIKEAGIHVLRNEKILIDGVQLIGVDDHDSVQNDFSSILNNLKINKNLPSILLKHQPSGLDVAEKFGISLQISGHTHKAQMFPLGYIPHLIYKGFDYGLKEYGGMKVFTSSGVGTWGPPVRVGTDSEIIEFTFK